MLLVYRVYLIYFQKLINQELELVVGLEEARQSKEELVNDRKELSEQLAHLKGILFIVNYEFIYMQYTVVQKQIKRSYIFHVLYNIILPSSSEI